MRSSTLCEIADERMSYLLLCVLSNEEEIILKCSASNFPEEKSSAKCTKCTAHAEGVVCSAAMSERLYSSVLL
jgi:ethanolamine utilization protein EutP (predicted NTPase)